MRTARAAAFGAAGVALAMVAFWNPLTWWSYYVLVAAVIAAGLAMHGLIAAVDPPEPDPVPEPKPAELTDRTDWPQPAADETADLFFDQYRRRDAA